MRDVRDFLGWIVRDWIALISGVVGIFATALGLWGPSTMSGRWIFIAFGFVGIMLAAFNAWRAERRRGAREIKIYKTAFMRVWRRVKEIDERLADIERQVLPLTDVQQAALAKLGRLGEMSGSSFELQITRNMVDFIVQEGNLFRPTDAYRQALAAWAKGYRVPMVQMTTTPDAEPSSQPK